MRKIVALMFVVCVALVCAQVGADAGSATEAKAVKVSSDEGVGTEVVRIDKWKLYQSSGAELYREMCASCHGAEGSGTTAGVSAKELPAPPLSRLRQAGVPKEHWTYVILAPYEDRHHWTADGEQSMPCWNRIFRQATGSDAAAIMTSAKLTDYLDEIQQ